MKFLSVVKLDDLQKLVDKLVEAKQVFAVDLETTGLNPRKDSIVGVGLAFKDDFAVYVPIKHNYGQPFDGDKALTILKPLFESVLFCAYNALFETEFLMYSAGMIFDPSNVIDAQLLCYAKADYPRLNLTDVSKLELGMQVYKFSDFMRASNLKMTKNTIADATISSVTEYCGRDVLATYLLYKKLWAAYKDSFVFRLESSVFKVVLEMKRNGVLIDHNFLKEETERVNTIISNVESLINDLIEKKLGEPLDINLKSSKQIVDLLYNKLHLSCSVMTAKGAESSGEKALAKLAQKNLIVYNLLIYRGLSKLLSTYIDEGISKYIELDGRVRPNFNQSGTITGRFSCNQPNFQNLPNKSSFKIIRSKDSFEDVLVNARKCVVAEKDCRLVEFDYSQIEARVAAGITQEFSLLDAFSKGFDFHSKTASMLYHVPVENVTKDQRQMGKHMNFALSYGGGVGVVYDALIKVNPNITKEECADLRQKYLNGYSKMFSVAEQIADVGESRGYVETYFGRKIPVFSFLSRDKYVRSSGRRQAYNGVIQGTSADILKMALVKVFKLCKDKGWGNGVKILMTVHDSIIFEVHKSVDFYDFCSSVLDALYVRIDKFPDTYASLKVGYNFGELQEPDKRDSIASFVEHLDGVTVNKVSKNFVLEIPETLTISVDSFKRFKGLLESYPGEHTITLKSGQKEKVIPIKTSLGMADKEKFFILMKGVLYEKTFDSSFNQIIET